MSSKIVGEKCRTLLSGSHFWDEPARNGYSFTRSNQQNRGEHLLQKRLRRTSAERRI